MKKNILALIAISFLISSCGTRPHYVGEGTNEPAPVTMGLDRKDFANAAMKATKSLLESGALDRKDGKKYVVAIDEVINDTTQRIDTDLLIKKIRIAMLRSKKAIVTSAFAAKKAESSLSHSMRKLRKNDEVKQSTVAKKHTLIAPDLGLGGKIIQRNSRTYDKEQLADYYFQLTLTDLSSGLAIWEDESSIGKLGDSKSVSW